MRGLSQVAPEVMGNDLRLRGEDLATRIRDRVRLVGGSQPLVDALGVYADAKGSLYVGVPIDDDALQRELFALEFGSLDAPPTGIIRNELHDNESTVLDAWLLRFSGAF